jgi:cell wall-associated NlpC family hydrolase
MGCSPVATGTPLCLAACGSPRTWAAAQNACTATGTWALAILDPSNALATAENTLKTPTSWIGLTRSLISDPWMWAGGTGSISAASTEWTTDIAHSGAANLCAALDNGKLYSDDCSAFHSYACTSN